MNYLFRESKSNLIVVMLLVMTGCAMQPSIRPVTDPTMRYTGNGFSALPPQGKDWYMQSSNTNLVVFGKFSAGKRKVDHTFGTMVIVMKPEAKKVDSAVEFPKAIEQLMTETLGGVGSRFRLISLKVAPFGTQGSYCSQYDFVQEERDNPIVPGVVLEITAHGFACLDRSSKFIINASYSERKTKEAESILDDALKQEADGFLNNVIFTPFRDSLGDLPVANASVQKSQEVTTTASVAGLGESAFEFYGQAEKEISSGTYDTNLWAWALVMVEGDEQKRQAKYIELRANQLYSENIGSISNSNQIIKKINIQQTPSFNITGTYRSKIRGDTFYFTRRRHTPEVLIEQKGSKITGMIGKNLGTFKGFIENETITIEWNTIYGLGEGKWKIKPESNDLIGTWSTSGEVGSWNLTKIE